MKKRGEKESKNLRTNSRNKLIENTLFPWKLRKNVRTYFHWPERIGEEAYDADGPYKVSVRAFGDFAGNLAAQVSF